MTTTSNYQTLGVEVTVLQKEMGEVKTQVGALSGKIDSAVNNLGGEMRKSIDALGNTINERGKTPWAVIWAGLSVLIILMGFIANQTLTPITTELATLRASIVPRSEHLVRDENTGRRLTDLEARLRTLDDRRYAEMKGDYMRLLDENKDDRQSHLKDMQDQINKGFARDHDAIMKENERLAVEIRELRRDQHHQADPTP